MVEIRDLASAALCEGGERTLGSFSLRAGQRLLAVAHQHTRAGRAGLGSPGAHPRRRLWWTAGGEDGLAGGGGSGELEPVDGVLDRLPVRGG